MTRFLSGTLTTCSASMATPWVCLHGWGAELLTWTYSFPPLSLAFFQNEENSVQILRYTLWIPLYPLGFICEGVIALRNIPYFEETDRFLSPHISIFLSFFFLQVFNTAPKQVECKLLLPKCDPVLSSLWILSHALHSDVAHVPAQVLHFIYF